MFGTPAKNKKSPKEVSDSLEEQVAAVSLDDPLANLPLTSRRGHDVNEDNWEERSKRIVELKRRNEEAELQAKMRLGMLSKREQQLLGPVRCQNRTRDLSPIVWAPTLTKLPSTRVPPDAPRRGGGERGRAAGGC